MASHFHHKWQRFKHKFSGYLLFVCVVGAILAGVVMMMLMLGSDSWRPRP